MKTSEILKKLYNNMISPRNRAFENQKLYHDLYDYIKALENENESLWKDNERYIHSLKELEKFVVLFQEDISDKKDIDVRQKCYQWQAYISLNKEDKKFDKKMDAIAISDETNEALKKIFKIKQK